MQARSTRAIRPLAFVPRTQASRASWRYRVVDRATFTLKRIKSATRRTSDPAETRDTRNRALYSFTSDIAGLRPFCSRADGTYISTDNRIGLPSGQARSKAALFRIRLL